MKRYKSLLALFSYAMDDECQFIYFNENLSCNASENICLLIAYIMMLCQTFMSLARKIVE